MFFASWQFAGDRMPNKPPLRVGLAGLGAVGLEVAKRLIAGVPGPDARRGRRARRRQGAPRAAGTRRDRDQARRRARRRLRRGGGMPAAAAVPRRGYRRHRQGPHLHAAVGRATSGQLGPGRTRPGKRRAHFAADRRAHRPRRRARRRRGHHPFHQDDHAQAAGRPGRRALSRRAQYFGRRPESSR